VVLFLNLTSNGRLSCERHPIGRKEGSAPSMEFGRQLACAQRHAISGHAENHAHDSFVAFKFPTRILRGWCGQKASFHTDTHLLSVLLSIEYDIIRHPEGRTTADHAVRQRFTGFLPDFLLPFGRLISVRSVVQLYPGPYMSAARA